MGGNKIGTLRGCVDRIRPHTLINGKRGDPQAVLSRFPTMFTLKVTAKLAALFGGSLLALFVGTLAIEDQRLFVACRASGQSADSCLLQLQGR